MKHRMPLWWLGAHWRCLILVPALLLSACSHYQLGTGTELAFTTLYVAPVRNDAVLPQAVAVVSRELRQAFLQDGRVQLVGSAEEADATLHLTLVNYGRTMTTARVEDTGLARKFDLALEAECTLRDERTGTLLLDARRLAVTRQVFTDGDGFSIGGLPAPGGQNPAEYQTLPLLAEQLADRVIHAVLDVW
jgi:hypothetical protein